MKKWPVKPLGECVAPKELWNEGHDPRQRIKNQVVRHDEKNAYPSVSDAEVLAVPIPLPPLAEQRRIVARLAALAAKQSGLHRLQAETDADLAAFTPALLAKAFRGEL